MDNRVAKLFQSPKTVLTSQDLALIWQEKNLNNLKARVAYYIKRGYLIRLTRGVFAKNKKYDVKELATSLYAPSYISFETVLREAGVIFQYYETIFVAGPWSKDTMIDKNKFTFRKLKNSVLYNPAGIVNLNNTSVATPERAFLDTLYLSPSYYFDNLRLLNWPLCLELVKIYDNKQLIQRVTTYYDNLQ